jgi:Cu/Ag efflux protein CusF
MRYRGFVLAALFGTAAYAASAPPVLAAQAGALIPVQGTVVRVDPAHRRLVLRHGPLETAPAGVRICLVADGRELSGIRAGASITALADTSRYEWRLRRVRLQY